MSKELRPMRGSLAERDKLVFPYMASPKLDGVRAFIKDNTLYSKSGKPIANKFLQKHLGAPTAHNCLDGELVCGPHDEHTYRRTTGEVRRIEGRPKDWAFYVFDHIDNNGAPATKRHQNVELWKDLAPDLGRPHERLKRNGVDSVFTDAVRAFRIKVVPYVLVRNLQELDAIEARYLAQGYEGVMLRSPDSPYKHGTATVKENYLLKLKKFTDGEAQILDYVEFNHNDNVAFRDAQGFKKRSSARSGKRPGNKLGKLIVRAINGPFKGKVFEVGTGYTNKERIDIWTRREELLGDTITFRCQLFTGGYDLPRIPTFQGFRPDYDMSQEDDNG